MEFAGNFEESYHGHNREQDLKEYQRTFPGELWILWAYPVISKRHVVLEATVWGLKPDLLGELAMFVDRHVEDVLAPDPLALVSEGKELSRLHVVLGVRRERLALQLAIEVEPANRLKCPRI